MKDILSILKDHDSVKNFNSVKISLASPDQIYSRSYGEIKKSETINYRTFKVERDGLFCAKIFGPTKDYECLCGKYKRLKHRGIICEKCGVEVTLSKVRRSRMANITLAAPVAHVWFLRSLPSKISQLLNISIKNIEKILYFESYIIIEPALTSFKKGQLITEEKYLNILNEYGEEFIADTGPEAILNLLQNFKLNFEAEKIKEELKNIKSELKSKQLFKRLKLIESFIVSNNNPEWMMLTVLPVLPPDLRPLVPLDEGRFASADLNDLYRRIINRNNRLKKLIDLKAPNIIIKNEKRMLQEAVDALIDNGRRGKPITGANKRPLKSLSETIKGKQGRFRQNLLGKRVDYSGRSVIVVGPNLKLNQCGIPKKMALELFKPFIFGELKKRNITNTIKKAKKLVEAESEDIWDILDDIIYQHPVLLNRAPTLHRLGIQAFEPILIEDKAIQLHPLVCTAFNADFDGDQMAVHIPLTIEAQMEARVLMLSTNNILSPANGEPIIVPTQDMVLGIYYMSKIKNESVDKKLYVKYEHQAERLYEEGFLNLHDTIYLKEKNSFIKTTFGRLIIRNAIHKDLNFDLVNKLMTKKEISNLINQCYKKLGLKETVKLADNLMTLGFKYATKSGISIGINDLIIPKEKEQIIENAELNVKKIDEQYSFGLITKEERYNKIIDIWSKTSEILTKELMNKLSVNEVKNAFGEILIEESFNPIFMMAESGARGSVAQIKQLSGMRGLMTKPDGSIIETPITANFREGLNILQYFISTHGARKGLADTALRTANSGYLTRRLVDVAQDVVTMIDDCKTHSYLTMKAITEGGNVIESLRDRIFGRIIQEDINNEKNEKIIEKGTLLTDEKIDIIEELNIEQIKVRSVIKCEVIKGVCVKCYGIDLATTKMINIGEAIGVIAAQSIGEPGTQLTMKTFHIGGAASKTSLKNYIQSKTNGIVKFQNMKLIEHKQSGNLISVSRSSKIIIIDELGKEKEEYKLPYGALINIESNNYIKNGDIIAQWDPHNYPMISEIDGNIKYVNFLENVTIKKEIDETTGLSNLIIIDSISNIQPNGNIKPSIKIINQEKTLSYYLSPGTIINVEDEQNVKVGDTIARIPIEITKSKDITGGLPRVADIFEARKPKDSAILAEVSGTITFGKETRGKKKLLIIDKNKKEHEILIPKWKNPNVFENEMIAKGEIIVDGQYNLHDILNLLGVDDLTEHMKREVQDVYRLQGVKINDKHIEVIIRQMLKKSVIIDAGDSNLLKDEQENISTLNKINENLKKENKKEIKFKQILLGITKASLSTDSFISAASFQETTRVLTDAAINSKKDLLLGLKENVITGKLIPAGTGFYKKLE